MNASLRILLMPFFLISFQSSHGQQQEIAILKQLNADWLNSYITKDSTTLAGIFADDFELINHQGKRFLKQDILANLRNQEIISVVPDSVEVKLLTADVGIVTAFTTFVFPADGKRMKGKNCYQDVYIRRRGRWWAVAAHVTMLSVGEDQENQQNLP